MMRTGRCGLVSICAARCVNWKVSITIIRSIATIARRCHRAGQNQTHQGVDHGGVERVAGILVEGWVSGVDEARQDAGDDDDGQIEQPKATARHGYFHRRLTTRITAAPLSRKTPNRMAK